MAKSELHFESVKKIDNDAALRISLEKDSKAFSFHLQAETNEILTLNGEFWEHPWAGKGRVGTMLCAGAIHEDGHTEIHVPLHMFRTKVLLEEGGNKTFPACFPQYATFEEIINSIKKGKKIKVTRGTYVYPGRSTGKDVDTVTWAE